MKRICTVMVFLISVSDLFACEFTYTLVDSMGMSIQVHPSQLTTLKQGESYTLQLSFYEDHRNCAVSPSDTLLMLDGARWRPLRESQGLVLDASMAWKEDSSRLNTGVTSFTALLPGSYSLDVIRDCSRGGYSANLLFVVPS